MHAPAGWYHDRRAPGVVRYFDGAQWTSRVRYAQEGYRDPAGVTVEDLAPPPPPRRAPPWMVAAVVLVAAAASAAGSWAVSHHAELGDHLAELVSRDGGDDTGE